MKCLCGSKNCRGVIGGAQDRESSAAARAALEAAAVDPTQLEEDPDYIMVTGGCTPALTKHACVLTDSWPRVDRSVVARCVLFPLLWPGQPAPLRPAAPTAAVKRRPLRLPCAAEKERDASLMAILDRVVGLGWEKGWTPKLSQR
mgnify:CR=1 FL=1